VKGEPIQGTIEDASTTNTDASAPPSGTSTPPTSASEIDATSTARKPKKSKSKRKRDDTRVSDSRKKSKTNEKTKRNELDVNLTRKKAGDLAVIDSSNPTAPTVNCLAIESAAVTKKLAKMQPADKAEYEARAAQKGQTLEQYVLRRIQKKNEQRASKYDDPSSDSIFFIDLEGDCALKLDSNTAMPRLHYTPKRGYLLPLGLQPTAWEREILKNSNMHRTTQTGHYSTYEEPQLDASSIESSGIQHSARDYGGPDGQNRSRYMLRSTKAELQLPSTDPSGNASDDLVPTAYEQFDDRWATEHADLAPEGEYRPKERQDMASMAAEPQRPRLMGLDTRRVQHEHRLTASLNRQTNWEFRFDF